MAGQGRRRGGAALVAGVALLSLLVAAGADDNIISMYIVGDAKGWRKDLEATWLPGKTFYAGDELVFGYDRDRHNVSDCRWWAPRGTGSARGTGDDMVPLRRGVNYFICSQPGQCQDGMKLAVTAL